VKRFVLIGMMVVFTVVSALPAVALLANNPSVLPIGRAADSSSFTTAGRAEYCKPKAGTSGNPCKPKPCKPSLKKPGKCRPNVRRRAPKQGTAAGPVPRPVPWA
jgi:hypothetical protein